MDWAWLTESIFVPLIVASVAVFSALKNLSDHHQRQFEFKTYEEIRKPIDNVKDKSGEYMALLNSFCSQIRLNYNAQQQGYPPTDLKKRPSDYIDMAYQYSKSLSRLMKSLESILIIEPRLKIFITALSSIHWEIRQCREGISQATWDYLVKDLEMQDGQNEKIQPETISLEEKERIDQIISQMNSIIIQGTCYIVDLEVELQNILLGKVYRGKKLKHRVPIDPNKIVISIAKYDVLKKYFSELHPMGQEQKQLIATIKQQLGNVSN